MPTISDFLLFPSPTKLRELGPQRGEALVQHLGNSIDDVEVAVQTVIKTCSVVTTDDNKTREEACQCADAVLSRVFSSDAENRASAVANIILVHLGLIKSEDKKFKPLSNIKGVLVALQHIVKQKYFPKFSKDILICFLAQPNSQLDACVQYKHDLLSALHQ